MRKESDQARSVITLEDLLHHCPAISQQLEWDGKSLCALFATSHGVRTQLSAALRSCYMVFNNFPSTGLATYHSWPALQDLTARCGSSTHTSILYLVSCSLPHLRSLNLCSMSLDLQAATALSEGNWPKLQQLHLADCVHSRDALQQLAQGSWPMLTDLDISRYGHNQREFDQIQDLSLTMEDPLQASRWPLLRTLGASGWNCIHLSANRWPELSNLTISHITANSQAPKLKELTLHDVIRPDSLLHALAMECPALEQLYIHLLFWREAYSSPGIAASIASREVWPALQRICLPNQQLGRASMAPLLQTDWSQLQELDLSSNHLHAGSIQVLVACDWPSLAMLSLTDNALHADAVEVLIQGKWPLLRSLKLSGNNMCQTACQHLARGAWPNLVVLDLFKCKLKINYMHQLLQGCWPNLELLNLKENADLSFVEVYQVAQDVAIHKSIDCRYANLFADWLEEWGYAVKYYKDSNLSSDVSSTRSREWLFMISGFS